MTTIAYKDGVIAYDSRITQGGIITDDDFSKKVVKDGVFYFLAGPITDFGVLIDNYSGGYSKPIDYSAAIIVDKADMYYSGISDDDAFWKEPLGRDKVIALGSGKGFALTAMDMGATAKEAVKMAMIRDVYTGGRIRTFKVPK